MLVTLLAGLVFQQQTPLEDLTTYTYSGKQSGVLDGYVEAELMSHEGSGTLTHMWFGGNWQGFDKTRLRVFVDGEKEPSIDMELGMGHGVGFGDMTAPWGDKKLGRTGAPSGLYNSLQVPYSKSIRITAQRHKDSPEKDYFWWILRGTDGLRVNYAGRELPETARLKLDKLEDFRAEPYQEFDMSTMKGPGALYLVSMKAQGLEKRDSWYGLSYMEAIVRGYFNGSKEAQWLSSGLEDYFLGTYYFQRGRYANDLAGLTHLDKEKMTFSAYRFHDEDPIFFKDSLRLTCRCGELLGDEKLHDPPPTAFTTYVWYYTW